MLCGSLFIAHLFHHPFATMCMRVSRPHASGSRSSETVTSMAGDGVPRTETSPTSGPPSADLRRFRLPGELRLTAVGLDTTSAPKSSTPSYVCPIGFLTGDERSGVADRNGSSRCPSRWLQGSMFSLWYFGISSRRISEGSREGPANMSGTLLLEHTRLSFTAEGMFATDRPLPSKLVRLAAVFIRLATKSSSKTSTRVLLPLFFPAVAVFLVGAELLRERVELGLGAAPCPKGWRSRALPWPFLYVCQCSGG
ncbi:hypothetical protein BDN67DRAFT_635606 [Paxillus ammoniavirescens]|nr:hypothetical protein BDN67DRAFT_635606 [Paxillus ammoniavirescens]